VANCRNLLALLLLIPAGCSTVPHGETPPDVTVEPDTNAPVVEVQSKPKPPPATPPPQVAPAPVVVSPPPPANQFNPAETWIPLERWCQLNGFTAPRRVSNDAPPAYSFASTNGTMVLRIGSQLAWWDDVEYRLGFAPQLMNGRPYIQHLDVQKNFLPLVDISIHHRTNHFIVIDPGHGGTDTGTRSVFNGHFEKEYTLDWAMRLQELLVTNGWSVWLTRTGDYNLPLPSRVAFAEQHNADLFLSLHFNSSFPDREQSGLETYCLTPTGMPSNLTRGFKDNAALTFPNNRFDTENLQYAVQLHRAILNVNGHADRGVRRARFLGVLQGQNRPAVLMEGGYLSNPREAQQIADPAYRQRLAEAVARALLEDAGMGMKLASQAPAAASVPANSDGKAN
jgi:N-acetylmuramoyl-L-alanine amidase